MSNSEIIWCVDEARQAMRAGHLDLAERYLEKIEEQVWCMTCHEPLGSAETYHPHFKGFKHYACDKYAGRGGYLRQQEGT